MVRMFKFFGAAAVAMIGVGISGVGHDARADSRGMPEVGAFEALSAGNKKIAEALFNGQIVTPDGKAPLSLDLIAASKRRDGWGRIFKQLKRDGLIDAKNLGELVRGGYRDASAGRAGRTPRSSGSTVVTTAGGRQIIVDKKRRRPKKDPKYTAGLFSNGSTYRGRLDYTGESRNASSLGISSAKGVGTSSFIAGRPKPRSSK